MERLSGHSALTIGDKMIVYGGKTSPCTLSGEVIALDIATGVWNRILASGVIPRARAFHSAIAYESSMVVFGGLIAVGMDDVHYNMFNVVANADALPREKQGLTGLARLKPPHELTKTTQRKVEPSSLYCLNVHGTASWSPVRSMGSIPPTRCYHSATVYSGRMFITGGYSVHTTATPADEELQAVYSTFALDLQTLVWQEILSPFSIPKRWGCSSILSGNYWILYGGFDISQCRESSAISVFNIPSGEWKILALGNGKSPSVQPRAMHTAVRWGDRFVVFGGAFNTGTEPTNQLCHFDLLSGAMSLVPRQDGSRVPSPRYGHSAVVIGNEMVVFGGTGLHGEILSDCWAMSLVTGEWNPWVTKWSSEASDNIFNSSVSKLSAQNLQPLNNSPIRSKIATQSESTSMDVLDTLRSHAALEAKRRKREEDIARSAENAKRLVDAIDEGAFELHPLPPSHARQDVEMRAKRFSHLMTSPGVDEQVWAHWENELAALERENSKWQDMTLAETTEVSSDFFSRYDQILSPRARTSIFNRQIPSALGPKQHLYVSPSLTKLGIRDVPQNYTD